MSNYFAPLHAATPAKPSKPPQSQNTKLLAKGRGPLKAPAAAGNTQRLEKAPAKPSFKQATRSLNGEVARLKAQHPEMDIPDWAWRKLAVKTLKAGPSGDAVVEEIRAHPEIGVPQTAAGKVLAGVLHPATDLGAMARGEKPVTVGGALADVGNIASNLVTPEKAGLAAGLFGIRGLKGAKVAADVAEATPSAANATKAAAVLAEKHGIPLDQVAGTGRRGQVTANDVRFERFSRLQPHHQVREGLKGARSQYGVEKAARSQDLSRRVTEANKALMSIADPHEALAASGAALRGKYAQIDYQGLKELNPQTVKQLMGVVQNHPTLGTLSKRTVMKALDAAVTEGRVPRPHEMRLIEHVFGKQTALGVLQQAAEHGLGDKVINLLNVPRSLMATGDLSGIGRQSLVAGASHPIIWSRNFPTAFKAMGSPAFYERSSQAIKDDPLYELALAAKVSFTDIGEHSALAAHEEAFASDYAAKIPVVGHVVKGSARAYVGFLNQMRMDLFKNQVRIAQAAGRDVHDERFLKSIGAVINASTGRGTLPGRAEHLLPAMNTFLFSPRLMLSRINYLNPVWYVQLHPQARVEALRGLFATAGAVSGALYAFSQIPGVKVDYLHPQSADWGKLKIGNTRIDIAAGFQQYVRLAAELITNTRVSSTTGKKTKLGSGYGVPDAWDVITQFGVNKLAPSASIAVNSIRRHDAIGNPVLYPGQGKKTFGVPFGTVLPNNFTPLLFQDAKQIYNEKHGGVDGITWALGGYGLGAFGVGLQTYAPKAPKASSGQSGYFGSPGGGSAGGSSYFGSP